MKLKYGFRVWLKAKHKIIQNFISYFGESLFKFNKIDDKWQFVLKKGKSWHPIVVIARQHYLEFLSSYPITQKHELRQVLNSEYEADAPSLHLIYPLEGNQRKVHTFVLSTDVTKKLLSPCIVLPESLLLRQALPDNTVATINNGQVTYFASSHHYNITSQLQTDMCNNVELYSFSAGIPSASDNIHVATEETANYIIKGLSYLPFNYLNSFWFIPKLHKKPFPWKVSAIASIFALCLYMVFSSVYLHFSLNKRDAEMTNISSEVASLLDLQQKIEANAEQLDGINKVLLKKNQYSIIWLLVLELVADDDIEISNITINSSGVLLRGSADTATDVLQKISQLSYIEQAQFNTPVNRSRNKDTFSIALSLKQPTRPTDNVEVLGAK